MIIQSILQRDGGSQVTLDNTIYHFKPTPKDPRHLAEVLIKAHAERFLSISEGYRLVAGIAPEVAVEAPVDLRGRLKLSTAHASQFELADQSVIDLFELTEHAYKESGLDLDTWNSQEDEDHYQALDDALAELNEQALADLANSNHLRPAPVTLAQEEEEDDEEEQARREQEDREQEALEAAELARVLEEQEREQEALEAAELARVLEEQERELAAKELEKASNNGAGTGESTETTTESSNGDAGSAPKPAPAAPAAQAAPAPKPEGGMTPERAELAAAYEKKMGRKPHWKMSDASIKAVLTEEE